MTVFFVTYSKEERKMIRVLPQRDLSAKVWRMAGPVVVGMISQTLLNIVDTAMVGRLGAISLAAAGLGGILSWTVLGAIGALHIGVQAVSSRRYGEKKYYDAGKTLDNSLFIAVVVGLFTSLFVSLLMREGYSIFTNDPLVIAQGRDYIFLRLLGALPYMVIMACRGFFNGIGDTKLHMRVAIAINAVNVLFNYLFIFGKFGFPRMETAGAGLASTIGTFVGMFLFLIIGLKYKKRSEFRYYSRHNLDRKIMKRIVDLSAASGIRIFLAMIGFSIFSAIVSRLGTVEMAATNVILTIISMSFLPGAGFGVAAASLIGQKLGEGKPDEAEEYGWESVRLGMIVMGFLGMLFILIPGQFMMFFTNDETVIKMGILPLRLIGLVQIIDAVGMVLMGALEGAGLNRFVMFAEISVNWFFFLPATYVFAFVFGWGLTGAWSALIVYIILLGLIVSIKYIKGSWKTVEV
jgi:putative MATE family efflux protein